MVDKNYCMSSFLAFRYIVDPNKTFKEGLEHDNYIPVSNDKLIACATAKDIDYQIQSMLEKLDLSNAAILLSGGMDSAILASYMPKGTKAYTAKCSAVGAIDETERAKAYCDYYGLEHIVVDVTWEDYLENIDKLMLNDGCPVFANEPQVYKLTTVIKDAGAELIILGDNADMAFGGMDGMLSKDWDYEGWKNRYTFVKPESALKNPVDMDIVYQNYKIGENGVDFLRFIDEIFGSSSSGAYINSFKMAGMKYFDPYAYLKMKDPLDLARVRAGESKYLLRELFKMKYPEIPVPEKIAMPRAMNQWMADWTGPTRKEFLPHCTDGMTGEQKFLVYSLERFLNLIEE